MMAANTCILFQGDSITDAGRDRGKTAPNDAEAMGNGYAYLAMARLLADFPRSGLRVFNRGISGNRVPDITARWSADCLSLQPDVLSILIGINDLWHKMEGRYSGSVRDYEQGYRALLQETRRALPQVRLVVGEPFALRCGAVTERWFPEFEERRQVAVALAREAGAVLVPFQSAFDRVIVEGTAPEYWAADGVHPTPQGHQLMADTWLAVVEPRQSGPSHLVP
jgi:lysophospholipase L1-like esterase